MSTAIVKELEPAVSATTTTTTTTTTSTTTTNDGAVVPYLRCFSLSLNGIDVHLSSIGASISKLLVPNYNQSSSSRANQVDDVVLGYKSPMDMVESDNPQYFGVIVGRVANRIAKGRLAIPTTTNNDDDDNDGDENVQVYELDCNNGPNHLHGGYKGFSRRVWNADIVSVPSESDDTTSETKGVQFTLTSNDGDQGYPGTVEATATYSLVPIPPSSNTMTNRPGATLRLVMTAKSPLDDGKVVATPISMAQHSYFNLKSHNDANGILQHKLTMPSEYYTPVDDTLIPTRQVCAVSNDPCMDWRHGKYIKDALVEYGVHKAGLSITEAKHNVTLSGCAPHVAKTGTKSTRPGEPYGFDHNYLVGGGGGGIGVGDVVSNSTTAVDELNLAGMLECEETQRCMSVWTDQPGIQVYTGNFLDGTCLETLIGTKDSSSSSNYRQWQAICLETQTFPDSIMVNNNATEHAKFSQGKCHILRPNGPTYHHTVEYRFEPMKNIIECKS